MTALNRHHPGHRHHHAALTRRSLRAATVVIAALACVLAGLIIYHTDWTVIA